MATCQSAKLKLLELEVENVSGASGAQVRLSHMVGVYMDLVGG